MTKAADKFEATRVVVETIKDFELSEQEMIFRWAAESLGLPPPFEISAVKAGGRTDTAHVSATSSQVHSQLASASGGPTQDIKSFVEAKNPRSDIQFAATVAYYYQFVAPPSDRKAGITKEDLKAAYRLVGGRAIPPHLDMTLNNAYMAGSLDRRDKGTYAINSVGENLVALTLPGDGSTKGKKKKRKNKSKKKASKKA